METVYMKYLQRGHELMREFIVQSGFEYVADDYSLTDGRRNSEEMEKDMLEFLFSNSSEFEELTEIDGNETDTIMQDSIAWYRYYKCTRPGFENLYAFVPVSTRHWFDVAFAEDGFFYPINIKASSGLTQDNLFGLAVLKFILFGTDFAGPYGVRNVSKASSEMDLAVQIVETLSPEGDNFSQFDEDFHTDEIRDYFFLSVNKIDGTMKINSFLNLPDEAVKINPRNGFQGRLDDFDGITDGETNFGENIVKVIYKFYEYTEKKAGPYRVLAPVFGRQEETESDEINT